MKYEDNRAFAIAQDGLDPLRRFREQFNFPLERNGYSPVYLCGNSLGLQPKLAAQYVQNELRNWQDLAVDGHFHSDHPWVSYAQRCKDGFAKLTGSKSREVVAMNTLTVNLHVLMASFYRPTEDRYKIVIESQAFPSDRYAAASQLHMHGYDADTGLLEWTPREDEMCLRSEDLAAMLDEHGDSVALLLLPGVQYYTGQVIDMKAVCDLGREHGCAVGLDLAHAIGNVKLALHDWAPDFAAWCTYKYLNSGPGAIAGAFIHEQHCKPENLQQLHGWWGHDEATRFRMSRNFTPAVGADLWQMSCPPILSLAPVVASLEIFQAASLDAIRDKAGKLTAYLNWLVAKRFGDRIEPITPQDSGGCQLSLVVKDRSLDARALFDNLCERNVTGDWREPDVIRVAPAPLYNSYEDAFEFAERLALALADLER